MPITTAPPTLGAAEYDDPDLPGRYLTDGTSLFRLLGPGQAHNGYVEIEDCKTLEVWIVDSYELRSWSVSAVCRDELAAAA